MFSSVFRGPCNSIWLDSSQLSWSYSTVHVRRRWPGSYWYGREGQTAGLQSRLQSRSGWSRNWSVLLLRSAVKAAKSRGLPECTQNNSQLALSDFLQTELFSCTNRRKKYSLILVLAAFAATDKFGTRQFFFAFFYCKMARKVPRKIAKVTGFNIFFVFFCKTTTSRDQI